ncbi:uncharacterized protein V1510DRAFT_415676 [Dipodascopsis tothii]|uniref:uncharacterized protein n=1 Tax=Dipodascopsis tothii TaxID=44089 RepID=UPI0034CF224D
MRTPNDDVPRYLYRRQADGSSAVQFVSPATNFVPIDHYELCPIPAQTQWPAPGSFDAVLVREPATVPDDLYAYGACSLAFDGYQFLDPLSRAVCVDYALHPLILFSPEGIEMSTGRKTMADFRLHNPLVAYELQSVISKHAPHLPHLLSQTRHLPEAELERAHVLQAVDRGIAAGHQILRCSAFEFGFEGHLFRWVVNEINLTMAKDRSWKFWKQPTCAAQCFWVDPHKPKKLFLPVAELFVFDIDDFLLRSQPPAKPPPHSQRSAPMSLHKVRENTLIVNDSAVRSLEIVDIKGLDMALLTTPVALVHYLVQTRVDLAYVERGRASLHKHLTETARASAAAAAAAEAVVAEAGRSDRPDADADVSTASADFSAASTDVSADTTWRAASAAVQDGHGSNVLAHLGSQAAHISY